MNAPELTLQMFGDGHRLPDEHAYTVTHARKLVAGLLSIGVRDMTVEVIDPQGAVLAHYARGVWEESVL